MGEAAARQVFDNKQLLLGEKEMWANLRHLKPIEELEPPDPDVYSRLPLLIF